MFKTTVALMEFIDVQNLEYDCLQILMSNGTAFHVHRMNFTPTHLDYVVRITEESSDGTSETYIIDVRQIVVIVAAPAMDDDDNQSDDLSQKLQNLANDLNQVTMVNVDDIKAQ